VLDIAAGHGLFGINFAQSNPKVKVTALDWPSVLEVAKGNAAAAGVGGQYSLKPGSAFDVDFGSGYDVVLLTNFLHHFDVPTNEVLQEGKCSSRGGRRDARVCSQSGSRDASRCAGFSLIMLGSTPGEMPTPLKNSKDVQSAAGCAQ
jgi:hypothetical protein